MCTLQNGSIIDNIIAKDSILVGQLLVKSNFNDIIACQL